jgi:tetratricopeptide (TPR) repeat protein
MTIAATVTPPTAEQTKVATQQFERANQAVNAQNFDYGIELLQTCCRIDPANLVYRRRLRQIQKLKYKNNKRGSPVAWLTNFFAKRSLRANYRRKQDLEVLDDGESILAKNPWDTPTQLLMGLAAERLGMPLVAIFIVEQARQKNPHDPKVNLPLAEIYERAGAFTQAVAAYQLVAKFDPSNPNAARKAKDLAATHTIQKGQYKERSTSATGSQEYHAAVAAGPSAMEETTTAAHQTESEVATDPKEFLQKASGFKQAKQWEQARQVLQEGLQATKNNFDLQQALAELEIEIFRQDLHITRQKLKDDPSNAYLLEHQERLRKEVLNREMAFYRQRSDRFPQDSKARLELGMRLLQLGQVEEAVAELQHARRDPQLRGKAQVHLGLAFLAHNNWQLARRNLDEALQHLPATDAHTRKEVLYQLALGAAEQKDWPLAQQYGHECASVDYQYKDIRDLLLEWQKNAKKK